MLLRGIEGIPVIIRFKTTGADTRSKLYGSIEGIPVIIRFKTPLRLDSIPFRSSVLKVFQL